MDESAAMQVSFIGLFSFFVEPPLVLRFIISKLEITLFGIVLNNWSFSGERIHLIMIP